MVFWLVYLMAFTLWIRSRFADLEARADEVGPRTIPGRNQARTIAVCVLGAIAAMAVVVAAGYGALGTLLGSIMAAGVITAAVHLTIRDGEAAQRP